MTMTGNGKFARPVITNAASRPAFARLDAILAKSTLSDVEKIDRARRALFGWLPEDGPGSVNALQKSEASPTKSDV
jgi:hypothetical protein